MKINSYIYIHLFCNFNWLIAQNKGKKKEMDLCYGPFVFFFLMKVLFIWVLLYMGRGFLYNGLDL